MLTLFKYAISIIKKTFSHIIDIPKKVKGKAHMREKTNIRVVIYHRVAFGETSSGRILWSNYTYTLLSPLAKTACTDHP